MSNIALYKNASASSYVMPYSPSRAVDGSLGPKQRWLCNTIPCWMKVDFGSEYWINRWEVYHMPFAGWAANYVLSAFKLQGSLDGINWWDLDVVSNNTLAKNDRTFPAVEVRYVRLYVSGGLVVNRHLASIMELAVYEAAPTSAYLSNIELSNGALVPNFQPNVTTYSATVANEISAITITPTAQDPQATIEIDGDIVDSGDPYPVQLDEGPNPINIKVTSQVGGIIQNYTVNVTRASSSLLSNLVVMNKKAITLIPGFSSTTTTYEANVSDTITYVTVTPTAVDTGATIKVNNVQVPSGQASGQIPVSSSDTPIAVEVTSEYGNVVTTYNITIHKL